MYNKADQSSLRGKTSCTFQLPGINAVSVAVVGSFNDWSTTANLMQRKEDRWETEVPLPPGRHRYFFFALERDEQTPLRGSVLQMGSVIDVDGESGNDGSFA
jgi:1,4-alpha-glucan branching enzyme